MAGNSERAAERMVSMKKEVDSGQANGIDTSAKQERPRKRRQRKAQSTATSTIGNEPSMLGTRKAPEEQPNASASLSEWTEKLPDFSQLPSVASQNPHCAQAFANADAGYQCRTDLCFERELSDHWPRRKYRRRKHEFKTAIHWGQRKLLMAEIEFLTEQGHRSSTVVYAGAAPGTHIAYLAELFPKHTFLLYDPAPFSVTERENIICKQESFNDTTAQRFQGHDVLFISDVRAADPSIDEEQEVDSKVQEDMDNQKRWHMQMQPSYSLLKFRLSWRPGKTQYLSGSIRLPVWGPITTTECRLMAPKDASIVEYDNTQYEEQMFYFNTEARVALYSHSVSGEGLDMCYDCNSEVCILQKYLQSDQCAEGIRRRRSDSADESDEKKIARLSFEISRAISKDRTLANSNPDPEQRRNVIQKRQFIDGMPAYEAESKRRKLANDTVEDRVNAGAYNRQAVQMMRNMGWHENAGLGADETGELHPPTEAHGAHASGTLRRGLGFEAEAATTKQPKKDTSFRKASNEDEDKH
jgi:hypothetical protein